MGQTVHSYETVKVAKSEYKFNLKVFKIFSRNQYLENLLIKLITLFKCQTEKPSIKFFLLLNSPANKKCELIYTKKVF